MSTPSFQKEYMAIRFANSVPEYSSAVFATREEAIAYAKTEMFDYGDRKPVYIMELCGIVSIDYREKY